jgi:hypothetical protein
MESGRLIAQEQTASHNSVMATPFPLRLSEDLRTQIEARAKANGRSMNAEISHLLQAGLAAGGGVREAPGGELLEELIRRYGANIQVVLAEKPSK